MIDVCEVPEVPAKKRMASRTMTGEMKAAAALAMMNGAASQREASAAGAGVSLAKDKATSYTAG